MGNDGAPARGVAMAFGQGHCHVLIRQAVKPVPTQTALPCGIGQRQDLLDLGQSVVEGRVEAGHLWQIWLLPQQDLHGFEREWLVQRGQRNVALEVGQDIRVHAHGHEVFTAAVDDTVGDRTYVAAVEPPADTIADEAQCGAIRMCRVQFDRERRNSGLSEIRVGAADSLHLAIPQCLTRQWRGRGIEHRKLDAG